MNKKAILEGLLFISGDEGLTLDAINKVLEIKDEELANLVVSLKKDYDNIERGIKLETLGNRLKLVTKKEHKDYYQKLINHDNNEFLSQAALETLAIIAYNQPIVRSQVDEIRGVSSSHIIRKLILRNLIEEKGKSDLPGKPLFYGTTNDFLDYLGLKTIDDLPKIEVKETEETDEVDLFKSKYSEFN